MKAILRKLARPLAATCYRSRPLGSWPVAVADLLEVKTPQNIFPKAQESPDGGSNINIIFELLQHTAPIPGDVAECGVFKGASLAATGLWLRQSQSEKRAWGFDSFEGFDDSVALDVALGGPANTERRVGGFGGTSLGHVASKLAMLGLRQRVTLVPGYFSDTLGKIGDRAWSFVHLDCDIHDSYLQTLDDFYPRLSPGGIILFDEYDDPPWPGCNLAIDGFLSNKPEKPIRISRDNYIKSYIRKI